MKAEFQCIGTRSDGSRCLTVKTVERADDVPDADQPLVPYPDFPARKHYLCSDCANEPPRKGSRNSSGFVAETPFGLMTIKGS